MNDAFAVGAERHIIDLPGVPFQSQEKFCAVALPNFHGAVTADGCDARAIRAERDTPRPTPMAIEREERLARDRCIAVL
jgi:hypothetical protein